MASVATEHPEPITAIFTGPGIIWSNKASKATVPLHYRSVQQVGVWNEYCNYVNVVKQYMH